MTKFRASNLLSPQIPWSPEGLPSHQSPNHPIKNITTSGLLLPFYLWAFAIGFLYILALPNSLIADQNEELADTAETVSLKPPQWEKDLQFTSEIDKTSLPQNDTLVFRAIVELVGNPFEYDLKEIEAPRVSNLSLISSSSSNKTEVIDGQSRYFRIYTFRYIPKAMGMAYINPAILHLEHKPSGLANSFRTSRLEVDVKEPLLTKDYSQSLAIIAIALGVLILGAISFVLIKKRMKVADDSQQEQIPLETEYLLILKQSKNHLNKGDLYGFMASLPPIMREYFGKKFGFAAKGMSTMELMAELESHGIGGKSLDELRKSFDICDRVRFARDDFSENEAHQIVASFEKILESFEPKNAG